MRADWIKLMIAADRFPLRSDPVNNQLERACATTHPQDRCTVVIQMKREKPLLIGLAAD